MATLLDHAQRLLDAHPSRGVSPQSLAAVFQSASIQRLQGDDPFCEEGEAGDAMYFLMKGAVRVQRRDPRGKLRELAVIEAPALFGHMALIDNSPRSASCHAIGESIIATLDRATYSKVLSEPTSRGTALRRILLASLTRQLVGANHRIRGLIQPPAASPEDSTESVEDFDVSNTDIMRVSGVLSGWKLDERTLRQAEAMEVVFTDDQRRNRKNKPVT